MIDVRVGENDRVEIFDREREGSILLRGFLALTLKHSAVESDGVAVDMQKVTGSGDFACRTYEGDLQQLAFCYRIALEQDDQALLILGHQCRLQAATAPLIQKICEGIFIFAGVTSELDHHSLVFFHQELEIMSPWGWNKAEHRE